MITWGTLAILLVITILSTFVDNLFGVFVSKKSGGSNYGAVGAVVGTIVGLAVANIVGMLIGPFIAVLFEYLVKKKESMIVLNQAGHHLLALLGTGLKVLINIGLIIFIMSKVL